ncbi:MAG: Gfo/Idh/MocA family oxidoreductase [Opitutus sp.]|nr:Gfo/Idh/MocA family oxidoreductase [Opitutus sp.]
MIRAAVVGITGYGRWHLLMAMEQSLLGRVQLVGAVVINEPEAATLCARLRRHGVKIFASYDEMMSALAGRVDLVLLPTGIQWHAPMAIAALHAGAHVLVEKPAAATLQEVDAMAAAQAKTGRLLAVGFQELYVPAAHDIKARVLRGEIGALRRVTIRAQWPRGDAYYARNNWAGCLRVNGAWVLDSPANNAFAHFLLLALFWAGDTPATAAPVSTLEAELYRSRPIESFDTLSLRARTAGGTEILFYGSHSGVEDRPPEILLAGDGGEIRWTYERDYAVTRRGRAPEVFPVPDQLETRLRVLEVVVARLRGENEFIVEPSLARSHTHLVNALHEFFPLVDVAPGHRDAGETGKGDAHLIRGLDETIAAAAKQGALFSEVGAKWARPNPAHSLKDYQAFGGCWTTPAVEAVSWR